MSSNEEQVFCDGENDWIPIADVRVDVSGSKMHGHHFVLGGREIAEVGPQIPMLVRGVPRKSEVATMKPDSVMASIVPPAPDKPERKQWEEAQLERYKVQLAEHTAKLTAVLDRQKSNKALSDTVTAQFFAAYIEVAKGSIDRSQKRAELVTTAATAVGGLYTGILAFVFAVGKETPSMPVRGVIPTIFLGVAIVLAVFYLSFMTSSVAGQQVKNVELWRADLVNQRNSFVDWCLAAVAKRKEFLQTAVISLGLGVIALPLPFIDMSETGAWIMAAVAGVALIIFLGVQLRRGGKEQGGHV